MTSRVFNLKRVNTDPRTRPGCPSTRFWPGFNPDDFGQFLTSFPTAVRPELLPELLRSVFHQFRPPMHAIYTSINSSKSSNHHGQPSLEACLQRLLAHSKHVQTCPMTAVSCGGNKPAVPKVRSRRKPSVFTATSRLREQARLPEGMSSPKRMEGRQLVHLLLLWLELIPYTLQP